jgi:protein-disulfide isomerase
MKRNVLLAACLAAVGLAGCTRDDTAVKEKLDQIDKRLEGIETAIKAGGGRGAPAAAGQPGQQRPRPNPQEIYAVAIGDAPMKGNPNAKVTIIDAFEFP